jgi:hypothetical protein
MAFELKSITTRMPKKKTPAIPNLSTELSASTPNDRASGNLWRKAASFEKRCFCEILTMIARFGPPPLGTTHPGAMNILSCCGLNHLAQRSLKIVFFMYGFTTESLI